MGDTKIPKETTFETKAVSISAALEFSIALDGSETPGKIGGSGKIQAFRTHLGKDIYLDPTLRLSFRNGLVEQNDELIFENTIGASVGGDVFLLFDEDQLKKISVGLQGGASKFLGSDKLTPLISASIGIGPGDNIFFTRKSRENFGLRLGGMVYVQADNNIGTGETILTAGVSTSLRFGVPNPYVNHELSKNTKIIVKAEEEIVAAANNEGKNISKVRKAFEAGQKETQQVLPAIQNVSTVGELTAYKVAVDKVVKEVLPRYKDAYEEHILSLDRVSGYLEIPLYVENRNAIEKNLAQIKEDLKVTETLLKQMYIDCTVAEEMIFLKSMEIILQAFNLVKASNLSLAASAKIYRSTVENKQASQTDRKQALDGIISIQELVSLKYKEDVRLLSNIEESFLSNEYISSEIKKETQTNIEKMKSVSKETEKLVEEITQEVNAAKAAYDSDFTN